MTAWVDQEAVVASRERQDTNSEAFGRGIKEILERLRQQQQQHLPQSPAVMLLTNSFQNLPPKRGRFCLGRNAELSLLEGLLRPDEGRPGETLRTACLHGMRGVGKTHVALEYAYSRLGDYEIALWVSAETSLKLQQSFGAIAHGVGLADGSVQHPDQLREMVKRWLLNSSKRGKPQPLYS